MSQNQHQLEQVSQLLKQLEHTANEATSETPIDLSKDNQNPKLVAALLQALIEEGKLHQHQHWAAHMTAPISSASLAGLIISAQHNGNLLSAPLYPILKKIEDEVIDFLASLFHQNYGHFVAGGSYGNLEALWQAKKNCQTSSRIVYCSAAAHFSLIKACDILDLVLITINTDDDDKIQLESLRQACQDKAPLAIVATLGTSAAGAIDSVTGCIEIAKDYNAWCHVDAAWGGMLSILPEYSDLFTHLSQVDSVCFDPHKGWHQPKPSSVLLYKKPLKTLHHVHYLEQSPEDKLPGSYGGEAFLPLWCELAISGKETLQSKLQQCISEAEFFYQTLLKSTNWKVYRPETGIVCFTTPEAIDLTTLVDMGALSRAQINQNPVYRAVFVSSETRSKALLNLLKAYF